ncbi:MAG: hypothetical protein NBV68_00920 [Erythrobacter sp.]|uniref:hypothetical protein n=1 Tax=Erythrobacter sp. TaxID=1042 RepID=UPI0025E39D35|nr:hypothetical protein [Erythrobacter sp.]MCL9997920.1 hypothetical protein [Erythrobacter sp.]
MRKFRNAMMAAGAVLALALPSVGHADVVVRGKEGKPLDEVREAPASIANDLKTIVAQPSPSEVDPRLLGPVVLMKSAHIDLEKGTATLPLRRGKLPNGTPVWFILTDSTDENISDLQGLAYSPKLAFALTGKATRRARIEMDGTFSFAAGSVDFKPALSVTPGSANAPFPPKAFQPGSVGDADYTPLVYVENSAKSIIYNAPVISQASEAELNAMCAGKVDYTKVHDKVAAICPRDGTVTIKMTLGFTFDKPIMYLSTEANDPLVASLENATFTPAMKDMPFALEDASPGESAERIVVVVNGPTGKDNPHRQGLVSALSGEGGPLNVLGGIPTINLDYSPMWRLFPAVWTEEAIQKGYRYRMTSALQAAEMSHRGFIKSLDGGDFRAVGFIVNCPVVYRIN